MKREYYCLSCGHRVRQAVVASQDKEPSGPKVGDPMVCGYCAYIMVWDEGNILRRPTIPELQSFGRSAWFRDIHRTVVRLVKEIEE